MNYIFKIIIFILLLCIINSCSKKENNSSTSIVEKIYNIEDITSDGNSITWVPVFTNNGIHYPVFLYNHNDEVINGIIEDEIYKIDNNYEITLKSIIDFEVKYIDENYISILFSGYPSNEEHVYSETILWPVMIDIENGSILTLNDIVSIDDSFIELSIKELEYYFAEIEIDLYEYYSKEEIKKLLLNTDRWEDNTIPDVRSYFTKDKIFINFNTPRVLDEFTYIEFSMDSIKKKIVI